MAYAPPAPKAFVARSLTSRDRALGRAHWPGPAHSDAGAIGSPEFNAAYHAAVRGEPAPPAARREDDIRSDGKGGFLIEIDRQTLDRLKAMRGPSESCGDVIGRLARADGA